MDLYGELCPHLSQPGKLTDLSVYMYYTHSRGVKIVYIQDCTVVVTHINALNKIMLVKDKRSLDYDKI